MAYLEGVWQAVRNDAPVHPTHRQATALAGELYCVWADSESRARSSAMVHAPDVSAGRRTLRVTRSRKLTGRPYGDVGEGRPKD